MPRVCLVLKSKAPDARTRVHGERWIQSEAIVIIARAIQPRISTLVLGVPSVRTAHLERPNRAENTHQLIERRHPLSRAEARSLVSEMDDQRRTRPDRNAFVFRIPCEPAARPHVGCFDGARKHERVTLEVRSRAPPVAHVGASELQRPGRLSTRDASAAADSGGQPRKRRLYRRSGLQPSIANMTAKPKT